MKSLHLGMGWFPDETGGLNRYFRGLVESLDASGEPVRAVVVGPATDAPAPVTPAGRRDDPLMRRLRAFSRAAARSGADADVVHAHFALYALLPVLGPLRRLPLVVQFQGPWADEAVSAGRASRPGAVARRLVERRVYRRGREFAVLSGAFRRVLVERYRVPPWRVRLIPPGVDLDVYSPGDRAAARASLGIDTDAFVGFTARRLVPRMGVDVLLAAWALLDGDDYGDRVLLIAGEGSERAELERRAFELGIDNHVRFLGNLGDDGLVPAYRAADVFVVPTIALEGFGIVVLEATACGTPVIATDVGGLPEVVAPLDESLVVPAGDAPALAVRLAGPLPNRDACRSYAERYTWARAAQAQLAMYRDAVDPPRERRLRVVYVDHCAQLAGGEIALLRLLAALDDVDAHVILGEDGPLTRRLARASISYEVLPFSQTGVRRSGVGAFAALRSLPYTLRLARRLRAYRPDLVHTNSLKAALYGGAAARLAGTPCVWHIRDRIAEDYLPAPAVRAVRLGARLLPSAVIANSQATLATLPGQKNAFVVPSPVPAPDSVAKSRDVSGRGAVRVGIVGRLAPWKGQHVFLEAFARALGGTDARALVVGEALFGEDDYAVELRSLATRLGLDGRVEFTGFVDDVAAELARLDVLVHGSVIPEPFGLAVVEGMAAGLPVVAADAGGPAEVIRDGVDGVLYPAGDVDALATALRVLAADPALRTRLGEAARLRAGAFEPASVAAQVREVYRSVASR